MCACVMILALSLGSQPPKIQPGAVVEGGSINVLCIAMGTPAPSVSLYVSGMLAHTEKETRHLVVTLHNITRHMRQLSCYADNGFGTPMQASKQIVVNCKYLGIQFTKHKSEIFY